jgi:hypothetical protein
VIGLPDLLPLLYDVLSEDVRGNPPVEVLLHACLMFPQFWGIALLRWE